MVREAQGRQNRRSRAGTHDPRSGRGQALRRESFHHPPRPQDQICVNLRNRRVHSLRAGRWGLTDLITQNKANLDQDRSALIAVLTKSYEQFARMVCRRKQSQFAALRLLRRRAPRNDMTTHVPPDGRKTCLRERRHGTRLRGKAPRNGMTAVVPSDGGETCWRERRQGTRSPVCSVPVRASSCRGGGPEPKIPRYSSPFPENALRRHYERRTKPICTGPSEWETLYGKRVMAAVLDRAAAQNKANLGRRGRVPSLQFQVSSRVSRPGSRLTSNFTLHTSNSDSPLPTSNLARSEAVSTTPALRRPPEGWGRWYGTQMGVKWRGGWTDTENLKDERGWV